MNRAGISLLAVCAAIGLSGEVAAQDALELEGTEREQHAHAIFTGVFVQCRAKVASDTAGLVAIVFSVDANGKFGATSALRGDKGKDEIRVLANCMASRANKARSFPKAAGPMTVGVKYEIAGDGKLLMLGTGETKTLDGGVFRWARERPGGANS